MLPVDAQDDGAPATSPVVGVDRLAGALALVVLAAGAGVGGAVAYDAVKDSDSNIISSLDADSDTGSAPAGEIEKVAQKLFPSVTQVNVSGGGQAGSGTGIIISSDGQILTNDHVVESAADAAGRSPSRSTTAPTRRRRSSDATPSPTSLSSRPTARAASSRPRSARPPT